MMGEWDPLERWLTEGKSQPCPKSNRKSTRLQIKRGKAVSRILLEMVTREQKKLTSRSGFSVTI